MLSFNLTFVLLSSLLSVPAAAADVTPPTAPGTPVFSNVAQFAVTITWQPSTDDVGVSDYMIRRALPGGGTWNDSTPGTSNTFTIRDLTPNNNYTFTIIATDAAGNTSASPAASVRTLVYTAGPMCSINYQPVTSGGGSFFATVGMTNLTPGAWQEWTLGFTLADTQAINPAWGFQRNGNRWAVGFLWLWTSGAGPLLPGNTRTVQFDGSYTGSANPPPTEFTINDHPCTVSGVTTPPGPPVNLTASNVTPGSVTLTWTAAAQGTNPIRGYQVQLNGVQQICVGVNPLGCLVSGLSPGTPYMFSVRAVDTTGLAGPPATIVVQTPPAIPPSPPGDLIVTNVTATSATLSWTASTPGSAPLAGYVIYRVTGTTETAISITPTPATTTHTLNNLTPNTAYVVRVRARDITGVLSGPSRTVAFATLAPPSTCTVAYTISDWGNGSGFTANLVVTNTGTAPISGWTLGFSFATAAQRVGHGWSATWTQPAASPDVTAANLDWNATIQPGASVTIGFNGSYTAASGNPKPAAFTLNTNPCTSQIV
ncbi:MAG TPA: fibronectin type III domain-containing protein [Candidatus Limnocylindrales bacterium]